MQGNRFSKFYLSYLLDICEGIATPKSLAIAIALRNLDNVSTSDLKELCSVSYLDYNSLYEYKAAASAVGLLKKSAMFDLRYNEEDVLTFYRESEAIAQNQRDLVINRRFSFEARTILDRARAIMQSILGNTPTSLDPRHGPGSTYALRKDEACIHVKNTTILDCSYQFQNLWSILTTDWYSTKRAICPFGNPVDPLLSVVVPGDEFAIVPKTIFGPRTIAYQPTANMMGQLAVGDVIANRFRRYSSIDIRTAQSDHHFYVTVGHDVFGTIDLSSASDSISRSLVEYLLPPSWFKLLDSMSCKQTKVGEKWYPNAKFMPQGCGFTFPLETCIFYSIVKAVLEKETVLYDASTALSVYGDDIIVPIHCHKAVVIALESLGFSVNASKSFGPQDIFKESCGVDTINGVNVRPYFLKEYEFSQADISVLANMSLLISSFLSDTPFIWGAFARARKRCISFIRRNWRQVLFVPTSCPVNSGVWSNDNWKVKYYPGGLRYVKGLVEKAEKFAPIDHPFLTIQHALGNNNQFTYTIRGHTKIVKQYIPFNQRHIEFVHADREGP